MTEKSHKKTVKGRAGSPSPMSARNKKADNGARGNKVSERLKAVKELQKTEAKKARPEHVVNLIGDALWLMGLAATLYLAISLISFDMSDPSWSHSSPVAGDAANWGGLFGAYVADVGYYLFGWSFWWWIAAACVMLYKNFRLHAKRTENEAYNHKIAAAALFVLTVFSPVLEYFVLGGKYADSLPVGAGGMVGIRVGAVFAWLLGRSGSLLIILVVLLLSLSLLVQISWLEFLNGAGRAVQNRLSALSGKVMALGKRRPNSKTDGVDTQNTRRMVKEAKNITAKPVALPEGSSSNRKSVAVSVAPSPKIQVSLFEDDEPRQAGEYHKPTLNLLRIPDSEPVSINPAELERTAELIESKLAEFGIGVQVVSATSGPVITRYEIEPAQGVKGSQIVALSKDLARSMSLQSVRIVETIAGKNTMGIELPNDKRQDVMLSEILSSPVFAGAKSKLTVALGKDIAGTPVVGDLAKMPHLLVAGMTGSGKSVGVNGMIMSMLFKATPDEVRFIMIDPKMLELSIYDGIPHLLCPVVTDMREAGQALNWCVAEMEKRYRLLSHVGVRNLEGFNQKVEAAKAAGKPLLNPFSLNPDEPEPLEKLPLIVVVIDELADLMMTERKAVEQQIARLAQKARAAGIHMIVATQRPSVDVVTGLIKANIPTRMAFTVQSKIDSRTILDQMGADELLKYGDSLFLQPGSAEPTRLQGAFVSDDEVHQVVNYVKSQAPADYIEGLLSGEAALETANIVNPNADSDELFDQAVAYVLESKKTSISSLQRQLRIGYNRAANLMEALENAGVVSPTDLNGSRKILAHKDHL
ncbi:DNA translocase FtsK 4TM domain-containing protein [Neisseria meningitidis]|uniref:DNA translocase FtsK n=1 Tax=Neisseria meningitidis TaxID=487 RepID=UPI000C330E75|nr:DNA translocase FtsK [Neisseria meningitidis]MBG8615190.1 DNA translocase FtsK [Neisseria meningitidis]MBG8685321.1 DNA translocase FtsK [Neisseria meningitidis]MBG8783323.1 DNA translocase FtsK [Neisseria meningitidis]MBG8810350.1 DNA translocase FtsK [Neisseria meningitidis]MBG8812447.1 DNA translocase FtsK [Neisseria meningitidis]